MTERNKQIETPQLSDYNDVVDYVNAWNDVFIRAINDVENLIAKYYDSGSLKDLHPFYGLLNAMKERSEAHSRAIDFVYTQLRCNVQELL